MSIRKKNRRRIVCGGKEYIWYVAEDYDSPYFLLNIVSSDKKLILSLPLGTDKPYIISKGRIFQGQKACGRWNRYLLPFPVPDIVTPRFVSEVILWADREEAAIRYSVIFPTDP